MIVMTTDPMEMARDFMEAQARRANAAVIGVKFNDPIIPSDSRLYLADFSRYVKIEIGYENAIREHAKDFCARSGATCGVGWNYQSQYDHRVTIHPPEKGAAYFEEARQRFPQFTFMQTIDPKEKPCFYKIDKVISKAEE